MPRSPALPQVSWSSEVEFSMQGLFALSSVSGPSLQWDGNMATHSWQPKSLLISRLSAATGPHHGGSERGKQNSPPAQPSEGLEGEGRAETV